MTSSISDAHTRTAIVRTSPMPRAADLLVRCLESEGVVHVFGVPGEENLDFLDALRTSSMRFTVTRHEQAAGIMAATIGRLTGKSGVCCSTLGPGATNLVTAAAYAQLGGMPMLMITGQKPITKSKQGKFQMVDAIDCMRPVTKSTQQIVSPDAIPAAVREAFRLAEEERPGAVHLELPEDVAAMSTTEVPLSPSMFRRPIAEEKAITAAVHMIEEARQPLLLIGAGANRKLTSKALRMFVERTGIPFVTTQLGKGVIDERSPRCIGTAALSADDFVHCAIAAADCVINVGHDVVEKPPFLMVRDGARVIHVNFVGAKVDRIYFPQLEVIGDIANAVWQFSERVTPQPHWDFSAFLAAKAQFDAHVAERADDPKCPMVPQRIVADLRAALPEDGILALDNGMYKLWFARNYRSYTPNTLLLDNALATMGAGLPSAIAAKLLFPDRAVVAVCGDGGFLMSAQELETAVRLGLSLVIVLINDNGFGMIQWKQEAAGFPAFGLRYGNPNFVRYAESFGAHGHRVTAANALVPTLRSSLASPGVHLIEVPVDYSENMRVFTRELREKVCAA